MLTAQSAGDCAAALPACACRGTYAPLPDHYSPQLHQLVALLLSRKADKRPSMEQVRAYMG